jgi:3-oxoacyl-[acyl-carrier-protein] synthase II
MVPSEGAAFLILESSVHAEARGARAIAQVSGSGVASDGWGVADPDPSGTKLSLAVEWALKTAGLHAGDVDALFAHGAASLRYDSVEAHVYRELLGPRAEVVPVTADKAGVGHTAAAGGAIGAGIAARALAEGTIPHISTFSSAGPGCQGLRYVVDEPLVGDFKHVLVGSAGLGGQAAVLALSRVL